MFNFSSTTFDNFSRQFSDGLISVETLVNEMEFKKLTDQYSFYTEKALSYLLKTGVENV